ncbi:MAG: FixH family protein [Spirochaetia bacterium]|nr:FixH family protein [Spirochaetia bacterium]
MSKSLKIAFILIGVFFLILFSVNFYYVTLAHEVKQPLIDERYYEKGLFFQEELNKKARAKEEKWKLESEILINGNLKEGENEIKVRIFSEKNIAVTDAEVYIFLERTATANLRQKIKLLIEKPEKNAGDGVFFKGKLNVPAKGNWDLSIKALINKKAALDATKQIIIN